MKTYTTDKLREKAKKYVQDKLRMHQARSENTIEPLSRSDSMGVITLASSIGGVGGTIIGVLAGGAGATAGMPVGTLVGILGGCIYVALYKGYERSQQHQIDASKQKADAFDRAFNQYMKISMTELVDKVMDKLNLEDATCVDLKCSFGRIDKYYLIRNIYQGIKSAVKALAIESNKFNDIDEMADYVIADMSDRGTYTYKRLQRYGFFAPQPETESAEVNMQQPAVSIQAEDIQPQVTANTAKGTGFFPVLTTTVKPLCVSGREKLKCIDNTPSPLIALTSLRRARAA